MTREFGAGGGLDEDDLGVVESAEVVRVLCQLEMIQLGRPLLLWVVELVGEPIVLCRGGLQP